MQKKTITALVAVALVAVTSVMGYALIGNKWLSTPRNILIDQNGENSIDDGDGGITAVSNAITSEWNGHAGQLITTSVGNTSGVSLQDGISMMVFADPFKICTGSCIGVTTTGVTSGQTELFNGVTFNGYFDSDIFYNNKAKFATDGEPGGCQTSPPNQREFDMEAIAVHEAGHLLGLGHSSVGGSTMFASTGYCQSGPATLEADDICGIECIYQNGADCSGSCGGGGGDGGDGGGDGGGGGAVSATTTTNCPGNGANSLLVDVLVEDTGGPVSGAGVTVNLSNSCGASLTGSAATSSSGIASFRLRKSQAETGPYTIDVTVNDPDWDGSGDTTSCSVSNANGTCQ